MGRVWNTFQAVISKNLFIARLKDARTSSCCREVTGQNCTDPIKLANPSFHHPSERDGDILKLTWPDCFDMSIDVTLPPSECCGPSIKVRLLLINTS